MNLSDRDVDTLLDSIPDAMVIVDSAGIIEAVNAEAEALFGYRRDELVGRPVELLLPARLRDIHAEHRASYSRSPRRRPMGLGGELSGRHKNGNEFPVEIALSPREMAPGTVVFATIRDVTGRRTAERELIASRETAERASVAKSALLSAASHDLRQSLQTLTLLVSVLENSVSGDSEALSVIETQRETLRSMAELLNALLDVSGLDAGMVKPDIKPCRVAELFARFKSQFQPLADAKGLELRVEDCDECIRTDPVLLGQIIQNLLANAMRYTDAGAVRLGAVVEDETLRIEVEDTGVGIPAEELDAIFDDFFRTSTAMSRCSEGRGLGLSIARRVARVLACPLDVRSRVGVGSCFAVSVQRDASPDMSDEESAASDDAIAMADEESAAGDEESAAGDEESAAGHEESAAGHEESAATEAATVRSFSLPDGMLSVVVDCDDAVADATATLLAAAGSATVVAADSRQAIAALKCREMPDLLICRDGRPGENAVPDTIQKIRVASCAAVPAIWISADAAGNEAGPAIANCIRLTAPVDADDLLSTASFLTCVARVGPRRCGRRRQRVVSIGAG